MKRAVATAENVVFALNILLVFLVLADRWITPPPWLVPLGRLHPLLVHFPIVVILAAVVLYFVELSRDNIRVSARLMLLGALTASIAAVTGFFLSQEGGYNVGLLVWHKWTGVGVTVCSTSCYYLINSSLRSHIVSKTAAGVLLVAIVMAGHLGASITHGEDYLLGSEETALETPDDSTLFRSALAPVLESKCMGCHNQRKSKGRLVLASFEKMSQGGKSGPLWKAGDPDNSLLVKRLELPPDHKKHMPPSDKSQPDEAEIALVRHWIAAGADPAEKIDAIADDTLRRLARLIATRYNQPRPSATYHFPFVARETVDRLNNPFRNVAQVAASEPAVYADFFVRQAFARKSLDELDAVKEQLVSINLSRMPVSDEDIAALARFPNLETLNLNNTDISGAALAELSRLPKLVSVSLAGTKVDAASVSTLANSASLKKVFLWNTSLDHRHLNELAAKYPAILWESGFEPDASEVLRLSAPLLVNEDQVLLPGEKVTLKATLPGTVIRYTTDGSMPDSVGSSIFKGPVELGSYGIVRAKSFKPGWRGSELAEFVFFRKGVLPARATLKYAGDKKYPGLGAETLIDGVKGIPEFVQGSQWIAFRDKPMDATFYFEGKPPLLHSITLGISKNVGAMTMPPASVEVWGGSDPSHLKLLRKVVPEQPKEYGTSRLEGILIPLPANSFACYKIVASPQSKLPAFRKPKKKDKGWLMMDEVIFN